MRCSNCNEYIPEGLGIKKCHLCGGEVNEKSLTQTEKNAALEKNHLKEKESMISINEKTALEKRNIYFEKQIKSSNKDISLGKQQTYLKIFSLIYLLFIPISFFTFSVTWGNFILIYLLPILLFLIFINMILLLCKSIRLLNIIFGILYVLVIVFFTLYKSQYIIFFFGLIGVVFSVPLFFFYKRKSILLSIFAILLNITLITQISFLVFGKR